MIIDKVHITKFRAIWPVNTPYFARQSPCACAAWTARKCVAARGKQKPPQRPPKRLPSSFCGAARYSPGQVFPVIMRS